MARRGGPGDVPWLFANRQTSGRSGRQVRSASILLAFLNFGGRGQNRRQDAGATNILRRPSQENGKALPSTCPGSAAAYPNYDNSKARAD